VTGRISVIARLKAVINLRCGEAQELVKPAARTVRMFDRDGLYLEVSPRSGKWWRLKYRYAGKKKRVSLGVYPEVNLTRARARTIDARQLLDAGVDHSENRRIWRSAEK
jgi:hypothetical protein